MVILFFIAERKREKKRNDSLEREKWGGVAEERENEPYPFQPLYKSTSKLPCKTTIPPRAI